MLADKGYDSDKQQAKILEKSAKPVTSGRKARKKPIRFGEVQYKFRWMVEAIFCSLKDFRRVAT